MGPFSQDVERAGDECWVPLGVVERWGWEAQTSGSEVDLRIDGRRVRVPLRQSSGPARIPLRDCLDQLGADGRWSADGKTLTVCGTIRAIEFTSTSIELVSTLPMAPKTMVLDSPERYVVDLHGARLPEGKPPHTEDGVRVGQYSPNVVRIVFDRAVPGKVAGPSPKPGRFVSVQLPWAVAGSTPEVDTENPSTLASEPPDPASTPGGTTPTETPAAPKGALLGRPTIETPNPSEWLIRIPTEGSLLAPPSGRYEDPTRITILLTGARVPDQWTLPENGFVLSSVIEATQPGMLRISMELSQPMGFMLGATPGREVRLRFLKPKSADGKLAGKTIVVDAGHGGTDSGARAPDGSMQEKNLTLSISRLVADALAKEGAAVILTRSDDTRVPLKERSDIANRSRADLFVSIHINSNRVANSRSGVTTYYHRNEPMGVLLAECLRRELAKVSGLPDLGTASDTRVYASGFAVLRNSTMPAVLLELGFINHAGDRKRISTKDFQNKVSEAVSKGLKVYLGDAKTIRPEP